MENKRYNIELEVVTPLCVGAGGENDWVRGADYVQKGGKVYVIDLKRMYSEIDKDGLQKLSDAFAAANTDSILSIIGNKLDSVSRYTFDSPATSDNPIKTFLRTQLYNRPLVAGTSLKGAIRSALFKEFRPEGPKDKDSSKENKKAFGGIQDNLMKFLQVADIEMAETTLVNTKVYSLIGTGESCTGGWKVSLNSNNSRTYNPQGFNTLYECVYPGETGLGTITYAVNAATSKESEKQRLQQGGIEELFRIINQRTREYLRKEKAFFEEYQADRSEEIINCIDMLSEELDDMMKDNKSCLLKMSAGVGFHSITGDWQYEDYTQTGKYEFGKHAGKKKYKSRKIAEYEGELYLMGFVALRLLSDKEADERRSSLDKEHMEIQQEHIARLQEAAEAEARRKAEAEAKQRAKQQQRMRQAKFDALFQEAKDLNVDGHLDGAIAKLNEALALLPNDVDALKLLAEVKKRQEIQASIKKFEEAATKRLSGSLADVFEGKSIGALGTLIATTQKWLKANPEVSIGDAEYEAIKMVVTNFPKNEKRNIKKNSKKLIAFLGQDRADELVGTF